MCPVFNDPTSFYRGAGPYTALQKSMPNLQLIFPTDWSWASLKLCDLVVLQRPCSPDHFNILVMAKDMGLPVIVDFDDDNLSVPKDNPMYPQYNQMAVKDAIVKLARHCDILTVSTENLKNKFSIYSKNVFVVPNALDDTLLRHRTIPNRPREKIIMWRGTGTHQRNLKVIAEPLIKVMNNHKDWKTLFLGYEPHDITEHLKNCQIAGANGPIETYKAMAQLHATANFYSLTNNDHAQARSHVSWLEATFGGCLMVAPKHPEFDRPGVLNFSSPEEFETHLESIIKGEVDVDKHVNESWKHIQEHYMLSRVNDMRRQLIEQVTALPV